MKKDLPLIMERIVYTYTSILFIIFIMKLVGLDYFGISMSSPFILLLDKVLSFKIIYKIICLFFLMFYQHVMTSLILKEKAYKLTLISIPFTFLFQFHFIHYLEKYNINLICEILYLFTLCSIYNKKCDGKILKRTLIISFGNMIIQLISFITRYKYSLIYISSPSINVILTLDYSLALLLIYKIYFVKGDVNLCGILAEQVGSSLQKLTLLRKQLKRFLTNYLNSNKKKRFEITLYFILILMWNIFTIIVVLFVAQLNHTFIECLFILTSFWLNKTIFGKAFHLKNALHCFIISNITYYCLNRITIPASISLIVPIVLGILLAYITSEFVKKDNKPLYKGMSEEELKEKLNRITNNKLDYEICKLYYVDRCSELKVSILKNYSLVNIKKRKQKINDRLKELII